MRVIFYGHSVSLWHILLERDNKLNKNEQVEKAFKQLKALKQNELFSDDDLMREAESLVNQRQQIKDLEVENLFISKAEKKQAVMLLKKYLSDYTIETISDKNTLCQLIYLEILNFSLQNALNDARKTTKAIPSNMVDLIHRNMQEIAKTKLSLGIAKNSKDQNKQDGFAYLQLVKKKYKKWLGENQATRTLWCPHCAKATLLKIKMDIWEAQQHPFFRDRILGNEHLISLYKQNKLTREDLAKIFEVSPDYVDWLVVKCWRLDIDEKEAETTENEEKSEEIVNLEHKTEEKSDIPDVDQVSPKDEIPPSAS